MSDRDKWKMVHLLNVFGRPELRLDQLEAMGIPLLPADPDLRARRQRERLPARADPASSGIKLDPGARSLVNNCLVGSTRWQAGNVYVFRFARGVRDHAV